MKLRNKKTGEIIDIYKGEILLHYNQGRKTIHFKRLEDLAEWEDYEEPKGKWFISNNGQIHNDEEHERFREERKQIGNYFETKEEAEKAVEKLKAWKRLEDNGFRFQFWTSSYSGDSISFFIDWINADSKKEIENDLDLLFGGE
jgi:hypothetical protein